MKKMLLSLVLVSVAIANDLIRPLENPIPRFNLQQETGSLSELERKVIAVCREIYPLKWSAKNILPQLLDNIVMTERLRCISDLMQSGFYKAFYYNSSGSFYYVSDGTSYLRLVDRIYLSGNNVVICNTRFKWVYSSGWGEPVSSTEICSSY